MKKQIAAVLMVLILAVAALAGCGGGGEQSPVVGEWKMTTIEVSGITMDMEEFIAATGQEDVNMSLTIEEDGNFSMDIDSGRRKHRSRLQRRKDRDRSGGPGNPDI